MSPMLLRQYYNLLRTYEFGGDENRVLPYWTVRVSFLAVLLCRVLLNALTPVRSVDSRLYGADCSPATYVHPYPAFVL